MTEPTEFHCRCHRTLGDDFYLLSDDQCLYGKCTDDFVRQEAYEEPINWYFWLAVVAAGFAGYAAWHVWG